MVSLGVTDRTVACRNLKSSTKMGSSSCTRSCTFNAGEVNSKPPDSLRNLTARLSSARLTPPSW